MTSVYIVSKTGKISKKSETLVFTRSDGTSTVLFPFKIGILFITGRISVSGEALAIFSKYKIPVVFMSGNGRFLSKLVYGDSKNVFLRQKQYAISENPEKSLEIARSVVAGKIRNQISFMQRIKRKNFSDVAGSRVAAENIETLKSILRKVSACSDAETLRGYEGLSAKKYYEILGFNLIPPWASFPKRSRNPPETNVNAVLGFLYTLLSYRVESAVESTGLDVMVGTLHTCDYGRNSLAYDLMEEFRIPIADTVCCSLFNLNILSQEDFRTAPFEDGEEETFSSDPREEQNPCRRSSQKGIFLTENGIKKVIKAFEEKMESEVLYFDSKLSFGEIIVRQVLLYKKVITGEEPEYKAFYFK